MSSPYNAKEIAESIGARIRTQIPALTKTVLHPRIVDASDTNVVFVYPPNVLTAGNPGSRVRLRYTYEIVVSVPYARGANAMQIKEDVANDIYQSLIFDPHFGGLGDLHGISSMDLTQTVEKDADKVLLVVATFFIETDSPRY